jgi:hypothetical protein
MPGTISVAEYLCRSACPPDTRRQAGDLLLTLAAVECHASVGGPAVVPSALRDLVIITARLAGRAWLDANAHSTADQILARVLSDRFGLPSPTLAA